MSFVNFRFFNYPGQPGLSSAPPVIPNILPVSPNVAISSQLPLTHPQGSCLPSYVDYSQHSEHPAELSPILQLENLGRHFENRWRNISLTIKEEYLCYVLTLYLIFSTTIQCGSVNWKKIFISIIVYIYRKILKHVNFRLYNYTQ